MKQKAPALKVIWLKKMNKEQREKVIDAAWETFYDKTGQTSSINRQISYAGIAVLWILASNDASQILSNPSLLYPALGFVAALGFDFLQYFSASVVWQIYCKYLERKDEKGAFYGTAETAENYRHPKHINLISEICFLAKCISLLAGYGFLAWYLYQSASTAAL